MRHMPKSNGHSLIKRLFVKHNALFVPPKLFAIEYMFLFVNDCVDCGWCIVWSGHSGEFYDDIASWAHMLSVEWFLYRTHTQHTHTVRQIFLLQQQQKMARQHCDSLIFGQSTTKLIVQHMHKMHKMHCLYVRNARFFKFVLGDSIAVERVQSRWTFQCSSSLEQFQKCRIRLLIAVLHDSWLALFLSFFFAMQTSALHFSMKMSKREKDANCFVDLLWVQPNEFEMKMTQIQWQQRNYGKCTMSMQTYALIAHFNRLSIWYGFNK